MKTPKPTAPISLIFAARFREDAHQLIAWGFAEAKSQIRIDYDEDAITGKIADGIKLLLESGCKRWFVNQWFGQFLNSPNLSQKTAEFTCYVKYFSGFTLHNNRDQSNFGYFGYDLELKHACLKNCPKYCQLYSQK